MQMLVLDRKPTAAYAMEWLDKAIRLESEGVNAGRVNMALSRACRIELAALGCEEYIVKPV